MALSGINKVGNNYYRTEVREETANGQSSFTATLYRTDAQGNNSVPIAGYAGVGESSASSINTTNATPEEQALLADSNSQLNQTRRDQIKSTESNFFGSQTATEGSADQQGGSTPLSTSQQTSTPAPSSLIYPLHMRSDQDRIKFTAVTYAAPGNFQTNTIGGRDRKTPRTPVGPVVFLPIQASIQDFNNVDWQGDSLNEIQRFAAEASLKLAKSGSNFAKILGEQGTKAIEHYKKGEAGKAVMVALSGQAANVQNLLGRFGQVLNPNLELLFVGPQLRPFSFTFRLSAREEAEANNIKQIINFFKKNMAVKGGAGDLFLKSPNTFFIEYLYKGSQEHPGMNKIKECALTSCTVDYTPNQTYMTFEEGTMVSYSVSLTFQELEPIYDKDYEDGHPIGY